MAPLPCRLDPNAIEIRGMLAEGRREDALTMVITLLRAGASLEVQKLAADLLRPTKGSRGRKKENPKFWYEIGTAMEEALSDGETWELAVERLAKQFGYSETHVRTAHRFYLDALGDAREG